MSKFNLNQLLNMQSKEPENMVFKVELIAIEKLHPSEMNEYIVQDVTDLKGSIELMGLQQNLLVRAAGSGYEVISGHRRLKAMQALHAEGNEQFKKIPCKIIRTTDDIQAELQLLLANSTTRELTGYERTYQAERLQILLKDLKSSGYKFTGRTRQIVADMMGVSSSQVARMDSINKKLTPELKEEFKEGNINITTAYELSRLPEEQQREVLQEKEEGQPLTPVVIKEKREEVEEVKSEVVAVESGQEELIFRKRLKSLFNSFGNVLESLNSVPDLKERARCSKEIIELIVQMETSVPQPDEILQEEFEKNQVTIYTIYDEFN